MPTTKGVPQGGCFLIQPSCRAPDVGHLEFLGIVEIVTTKPCLTLIAASLPSHTQSHVYASLRNFLFIFTTALKIQLKSAPDLNTTFSTLLSRVTSKIIFFQVQLNPASMSQSEQKFSFSHIHVIPQLSFFR